MSERELSDSEILHSELRASISTPATHELLPPDSRILLQVQSAYSSTGQFDFGDRLKTVRRRFQRQRPYRLRTLHLRETERLQGLRPTPVLLVKVALRVVNLLQQIARRQGGIRMKRGDFRRCELNAAPLLR